LTYLLGTANDWTANDWTANDWTANDWTANDCEHKAANWCNVAPLFSFIDM
jgi:hypothetical protein